MQLAGDTFLIGFVSIMLYLLTLILQRLILKKMLKSCFIFGFVFFVSYTNVLI